MRTVLLKGQLLALVLLGLLAGGCGRVINVTANEEICQNSVTVHIVGVNRYEKEEWEEMSMTDYWGEKGAKVRKDANDYTHEIQFGKGPCTKKIGKKDDIRKVWEKKGIDYIFVLAYTGIFPDKSGNLDARRLRLPAPDSKCWGMGQKEIYISIGSSKVAPMTIPKSKKCD